MNSNAQATSVPQLVIEGLMKPSSPDMLWALKLASETMDDPQAPTLLKIGAFLLGSFAAGQGCSDVVNRANTKPRKWIAVDLEIKLPREQFLTSLQPNQQFAAAKNVLVPVPKRPNRLKRTLGKKHHPRRVLATLKIQTPS